MQGNLQFEQPCHGNQMREYVEGCHVFYEPMVEYMEKFSTWGSWLSFCQKEEAFYHRLLPLCSYVLILIKHDERVQLLDKFLGWLHWKSEFT